MEYKKYRLGDIAEVNISGVDKKTHDNETPVRLCNFVDVYRNWAITKDMYPDFMEASAKQNEIDTFTLHKGQVAITKDSETRNDIGIATYIADDFDELVVLGYHTALISPDTNILNPKYLNALLHTKYFHDYWFNNATGSGMRYTLSEQAIKNAVVYLPTIKEQERIGNLFSSLDRKVSLNRKANEVLEKMAKQLYDYWFVQFDFPDENGKPYKSSGGKMVYNETLKREIPEGWTNGTLLDIANYTNGIACQNYRPKGNNKLRVIKIKEMHDGFSNETEFVDAAVPAEIKIYDGDVLFSWSASLEVMLWANGQGALNQHIFKVTSKNAFPKSFYYYQLLDYVSIFRRMAEARKTTMGHITQDHLRQSTIAIPTSFDILEQFDDLIKPLFMEIISSKKQITKLTSLRDFLLPMLMNGQVTIKDDQQ